MTVQQAQKSLIDPQLLNDCAVNARTVSHNPNLVVTEGKPGAGSYLISGEGRFVLDPTHCTNRTEAIWTACHEGMHEWQTPGFSTIPMTALERRELTSKTGFASTRNIVEDCAGNDGMVRSHIGLALPTIEVYRKQLEHSGGVLNHPEIMQVMQQIGREPKFARALALILEAWADFRVSTEDFSKELRRENGFHFRKSGDRDVDQALNEAMLPLCVTVNQTLISGQEQRAQVRSIGVNRFMLTKDYLFPLIERLVKLDLNQERQNQAAKKALKEGALSDDAKEEISKQQEERAGKQDGSNSNGNQTGATQMPASPKDGQSASPEDSAPTQPGESGNGTASAPGSGGGEATQGERSYGKNGDQGIGQAGEEPEGNGRDGEPQNGDESTPSLADADGDRENDPFPSPEPTEKPIDVSKLSDDARREIADYLDALPQHEREEIEERAKKLLQDLDDAIATVLKPKTTDDDSVPTHQQQAQIAEQQQASHQAAKRFGSFSRAVRDASLKAATPYQRIFMEIAPEIERVEESVRHLFVAEESEEWRGAFASGQRLNIRSALRYESDPGEYQRLFDRHDLPTSFSYEFDLLVDRSGSMKIDSKFEQTKKVAVFLVELLARFDIPCSVRVYDDSVKTVKKWDDDPTDAAVQKSIGESFLAAGGTNDALAIGTAYREATEREEKHKFILILSDAESGVGDSLRVILERVQSEGKVILFHFGIGPNTSDTYGFFSHSRGDLPLTGEGAFFEVFTKVLADLILDPAKYKGKKK